MANSKQVVSVVDDSQVDMSKRKQRCSKVRKEIIHDDEVEALLNKKRRTSNNSDVDDDHKTNISMLVEKVIATLELAAEEDVDFNRNSQPAVNKLKKVPLLTQFLSKKHLQLEFLDHGVLCLLKKWLEPLPDGSLANVSVRTEVLQILSEYPIDLNLYDRRDQLKKSGLGKVIMFLSRSDEETTSNKKLARDLVYKWSRPIFNISARYEDMKSRADEEAEERRLALYRSSKKPASTKPSGVMTLYTDVDLDFSEGQKSPKQSSTQHVSRPEPLPMDFVVRPLSKINPDMVRERAKQRDQAKVQQRIHKKFQQLKSRRRYAAPSVKAFPICV
ncbi:Transcription factor iws1 [Thalictrum thalictroides]|uniref:Transcription factor iws1 n=1 Tax=Thalictrum thalictroides TaxID=46969 RepID=A0A7J6VHL4_THATH|nr:Transcription factor iws1 [Thalictrum thalictroides]